MFISKMNLEANNSAYRTTLVRIMKHNYDSLLIQQPVDKFETLKNQGFDMEELEDRVDEINGTMPGDRTYSSIRPKSEHPYGTIN